MLDLRTDEQLMLAARLGDDGAFALVARRLRDVVGRFLRHLGCDPTTTDDLVQETLIRLWLSRSTYEQRASLRTYAFTVARNLWLNDCRRKHGSGRSAAPLDDECPDCVPAWARPAPPSPTTLNESPEARLLARHRVFRLRQAIAALPDAQRTVFWLAHVEGLRYAQIVDVLGIAEGTVKSRMHWAVRALRASLKDDYPHLAAQED